ncbi:hypothetical protein WQE_04882 [Paraburkholderia hospita]|uniref:Uncharacterized protein n=1 Tax=Paraburkholderia hospita TaxID=169430 RepID=A0ABP2PXW6_9BURK|nr:hypothetical protein [Paraburkholderia hospita]EIN02295.1 hypothetical protein WQE_04882 [Paraburkholderia hospita]OUL72643.1 hypothetical protein CA602_42940 [Paraburkholderia hospita]
MMANETTERDPLDVKEVAFAMDSAAGLFAHANGSFSDLSSLFEAIQESAKCRNCNLTQRLASLGRNLCDSLESDFGNYQDDYQARAECYLAATTNDASLRVISVEDSSKEGA